MVRLPLPLSLRLAHVLVRDLGMFMSSSLSREFLTWGHSTSAKSQSSTGTGTATESSKATSTSKANGADRAASGTFGVAVFLSVIGAALL